MISFSLRDLARVWANRPPQTVVDGFIAYGHTTTYSVFSAFCVRLPFPHTELCRLRLANNYRMRTYVFYLLISSDDVTTDNRVLDRKSTRLNSSHLGISYAVFC